ncbi:MAG: energy transducer TonB, partial [Bacteroidales bacterium]
PKDENAPPPPPPPPEATVEQKAKFTAPIVVTDTTETTEINQDDLNKTTTNIIEEEVVIEEDNSDKVIEEVIETPIFTVVEEMPSFPGGDEARIKFLKENINYPQMAKESGIQGTVYVTFVVDEKGKVTDVRVLRGIGGGCDEEAVRVVKLMPSWNAGKQSGKAVRVQFNMPIRFILS